MIKGLAKIVGYGQQIYTSPHWPLVWSLISALCVVAVPTSAEVDSMLRCG
jgi:hypothetical protein